jgi:hypothetical protein
MVRHMTTTVLVTYLLTMTQTTMVWTVQIILVISSRTFLVVENLIHK